MARGCGAHEKIVYGLRGAKRPYGVKGPYVGQKAHGHLAPFCPYLGGNNNVITYNFFLSHLLKPITLLLL